MKITLYREKKCKTCKKVMSIDNFYKSKSMKLGYRNECKVCSKILKMKTYLKKIKKEKHD